MSIKDEFHTLLKRDGSIYPFPHSLSPLFEPFTLLFSIHDSRYIHQQGKTYKHEMQKCHANYKVIHDNNAPKTMKTFKKSFFTLLFFLRNLDTKIHSFSFPFLPKHIHTRVTFIYLNKIESM
ncbi:hypothetical protein HMI54_005504 [Coelomomyces lativittatus]|nr:hypothetical protein HMI55_001056 [Coelomomyces lativittatus]KAJ1517459.1 hypothetical protein HMI54_005504 [Coelomomyces lativittatus]